MPRDEFNQINVTNESQVGRVEFGFTPKNEYSFSSGAAPTSELNASGASELNSQPIEDSSDSKSGNSGGETINTSSGQRYLEAGESASAPASSASVSTSTAASSSSASSAAAASSAASAASSGAVAASAVVVTAFAVVAAAPIILSNAHINEDTFVLEASESEVFYKLELLEPFEDEKYSVTLTNETYSESQTIVEGFNDGNFVDLESNETYEFLVTEGNETEITRILYRQKIETEVYVPVSEVYGATVSTDADFLNNAITVTLDYVDEEEKFSDFAITLTPYVSSPNTSSGSMLYAEDVTGSDVGSSSITIPLDKTTEPQTVQVEKGFDISKGSFTYSISYRSTDYPNGPITIPTQSNVISFIDNVHQSVFNSATLYEDADLRNNIVTINLDFVDDYNKFTNFTLTLIDKSKGSDSGEEEEEFIWALDKVVGNQDVPLNNGEYDITLKNKLFYFQIAYQVVDTGAEEIATSGQIIFTDSTMQSIVRSAKLYEEADFRDEELPVTVNLDFVDDYEKFYDFKLNLQEISEEPGYEPEVMVYSLEPVPGDQVVKLNNGMYETGIDDRSFNYSITYRSTDSNEEIIAISGQITFTDPTYKSVINSASVSETISMSDKTIIVHLDYQDDYGKFYDFSVNLSRNNEDTGGTDSYDLRIITDDIDPDTHDVIVSFGEVQEGTWNYVITYKDWTSDDPDEVLTAASGTVSFDDPNWVPSTAQFNGVNFLFANYADRTITIQLDYNDPDGFLGEDAELTLIDHNSGVQRKYSTSDSTLEMNNQPQELPLDVIDDQTFEGGIDVSNTGGFDYILSYYDNNEEKTISEYNLTVKDENNSVNGLNFHFNYIEGSDSVAYANSMDQYISVYAEYNNYFANLEWSGFQLDICDQEFDDNADPEDYTMGRYGLTTDTGGWRDIFYINGSELDQIDLLNEDYSYFYYRVTYFATAEDSMEGDDYRSTLLSGTVSFIDETKPEINSLGVGNFVEINSDFVYFPIQFSFANTNSNFNNITVTMKTLDSPEITVNAATYSGMFYKDSNWQIATCSSGSLEDLGINSDNPTEDVTFSIYEGDATGGNEDPIFTDTLSVSLDSEDDTLHVYGGRFEDMLTINNNDMYQISLNNLIFTGLMSEDEEYSPRFYFTIESGEGDLVDQEQVTVMEFIPTNMAESMNIILGALGDSYFDMNNEIVISVYIQWTTEGNDLYRVPICEHHKFYKQA